MALKILTLMEDSPGDNLSLKNEHGLSFYIEKDGHKLLFDTGQTGGFLFNAQQLHVDFDGLEYVVLSHGHYDHSGGFRALCDHVRGFKLVLGTGFFTEKYSLYDTRHTFKGNNFNEEFLVKSNIAYRFVTDRKEEILPGVYVVTRFFRKYPGEKSPSRYQLLQNDCFVADPFTDEILLVIDTPEGLVVLVGCSHPGIRNMLDTVKKLFDKPLYAVLGGIHLIEAPDERISETAEYFLKEPLSYLGVCHCTGEKAGDVIRRLNKGYFHNTAGSSLFIDW